MKVSLIRRSAMRVIVILFLVLPNCALAQAGNLKDLAMLRVEAVNGSYLSGDILKIQYTIKNLDEYATEGDPISFYLSEDSYIYTSDILLGTLYGPLVYPLDSTSASVQFILSDTLASGSYYVGCVIRSANDFNAHNNTGVDPDPIQYFHADVRDMQVLSVAVEGGYLPLDSTIQVIYQVKNIGDSAADPYLIFYYASEDRKITADDILLDTLESGTLPGQEIKTTLDTITLPANFPLMTPYYIGIIVSNTAHEYASNGVGYDGRNWIVVFDPALPEIGINRIDAKTFPYGSKQAGDTIEIAYSLMNSGDSVSGPFHIGLFASTTIYLGSSNIPLDTLPHAGMQGHSMDSAVVKVQLPPDMPSGFYYFGIIVYYVDQFFPTWGIDKLGLNVFGNSASIQKNIIPRGGSLTFVVPQTGSTAVPIQYQLPESAQTQLRVYDLSGRFEEELINSRVEAGTHTMIWNANNRPSGIYLFELRAGSKAIVAKRFITR